MHAGFGAASGIKILNDLSLEFRMVQEQRLVDDGDIDSFASYSLLMDLPDTQTRIHGVFQNHLWFLSGR